MQRIMTIEDRMSSAVIAIVTTRDMCGDETAALRDTESDYGRFTEGQREAIHREVEAMWRSNQVAAGVTKPISADERARIGRTLEEPERAMDREEES